MVDTLREKNIAYSYTSVFYMLFFLSDLQAYQCCRASFCAVYSCNVSCKFNIYMHDSILAWRRQAYSLFFYIYTRCSLFVMNCYHYNYNVQATTIKRLVRQCCISSIAMWKAFNQYFCCFDIKKNNFEVLMNSQFDAGLVFSTLQVEHTNCTSCTAEIPKLTDKIEAPVAQFVHRSVLPSNPTLACCGLAATFRQIYL